MFPVGTPATVLAASTVQTVGTVIAVLAGLGFIVYVIVNVRSGRDEVGSEIELAPNRKPYHDDETLETKTLDSTLRAGLLLLGVVSVSLPLYWLAEPGRQDGAVETFDNSFVSRGETQYAEGSQCQNCHGPEGSGGVAPYTVLDPDGNFVATVEWKAPALNTVLLRYTREEVEYIINFGRPWTPMPGWGAAVNKGPLNEQQVSNLVDYLQSIQLTSDEAKAEVQTELVSALGLVSEDEADDPDAVAAAAKRINYNDPATGRALFNLGQESNFASGAYACGRCHTRGWPISRDPEKIELKSGATMDALDDYINFPDGSGALGPNLTGGLIPRQFASVDELVEFITLGSVDGEQYGRNGQGSGKMPSFGDNPNTLEQEGDGMFTEEMIRAIATYEASLPAATDTSDAATGRPTTEGS